MSEENKDIIVPDFSLEVDSPIEDDVIEDQQQESPEGDEEESGPSFNLAEDADDNIVSAYQFYKDNGIIEGEYEDFDGTPQSLATILEKEDAKKYDAVYQHLHNNSPEFARPLLDLILTKGNELTLEEASEIFQYVKPTEYSTEDMKDEEKATEFLRGYYAKEFDETPEEVEERIDLLKDRNKLTKEAEVLFNKENEFRQKFVEKKVEEAKLTKEQREQQEAAFASSFNKSMDELNWRSDLKEEVTRELYSGNHKTRVEHIYNNPKALTKLVHFMSYYDGKDIDMDSFMKEYTSDASKKIKKNIRDYWSGSIGKSRSSRDQDKDTFDLSDFEIEI